MAVTFDAHSIVSTEDAVSVHTNNNMTVGSGSNRALIAVLILSGAGAPSANATWDFGDTNQAMEIIAEGSGGSTRTISIFCLVNPVSGNKALKFDWTGTRDAIAGGVAFTGVHQDGGSTSFENNGQNTGISTTASIPINSAVGDAVVGVHAANASSFSAVNETQIFTGNASSISGAANRAVGAAPTVTLTGTLGSSVAWLSTGINIKPAAEDEEVVITGSLQTNTTFTAVLRRVQFVSN